MIRRELSRADGFRGWLLISQRVHARLSGELAARCVVTLGNNLSADQEASLRGEMLEAIAVHDDGWEEWEQAPRLDEASGRPLNFNELPAAQSLPIWTASIELGRQRGLLAGSMIAAHFLRLLEMSESLGQEPEAQRWRAHYEPQRDAWRAAWAAQEAWRTPPLADLAAEWLWVFDAASLWLCLEYPLWGTPRDKEVRPWELDPKGPLASIWSCASPGGSAGGEAGQLAAARVSPWLFDGAGFELEGDAVRVAAGVYADGSALLAAAEGTQVKWRLAVQE
jgi:hypothetical protein